MYIFNFLAQLRNPVLSTEYQGLSGVDFFNDVLPNVILIGLIVGVTLFFFMFLMGAISWIFSGGDREKIEDARKRITNALTGLLILLLIFVITQIVNLVLNINIGNIGIGPDSYQEDCSLSGSSCDCVCAGGYHPQDESACGSISADACEGEDNWCMCVRDDAVVVEPSPTPIVVYSEDTLCTESGGIWEQGGFDCHYVGSWYCGWELDPDNICMGYFLVDYCNCGGGCFDSDVGCVDEGSSESLTATLSVDGFSSEVTVDVGSVVRFDWSSTNAVSCNLDGSEVDPPTEGFLTSEMTTVGSFDYILDCSDSSGNTATDEVIVNVQSTSFCGNGYIESVEECDGIDFGGLTCSDFPPFDSGSLLCSNCILDFSNCLITPTNTPIPTSTPTLPICPSPSSINATSVCDASYLLDTVWNWTLLAGATSYRIQIDDNSDFSSPALNTTTGAYTSSQSLNNLTPGTWYGRVRAETTFVSGICTVPSLWRTTSLTRTCPLPTNTPVPPTNTPIPPTNTPPVLPTRIPVCSETGESCSANTDCCNYPLAICGGGGICTNDLSCAGPAPGIILNSATGVNCTTACRTCYGTSCVSVGTVSPYSNALGYMNFSGLYCSTTYISCNFNMNIDPDGIVCSGNLRNWTYCNCGLINWPLPY